MGNAANRLVARVLGKGNMVAGTYPDSSKYDDRGHLQATLSYVFLPVAFHHMGSFVRRLQKSNFGHSGAGMVGVVLVEHPIEILDQERGMEHSRQLGISPRSWRP